MPSEETLLAVDGVDLLTVKPSTARSPRSGPVGWTKRPWGSSPDHPPQEPHLESAVCVDVESGRRLPTASLCVLGFQDPRLATPPPPPTSSPMLTTDGEALILQWVVHEGHTRERRSQDRVPERRCGCRPRRQELERVVHRAAPGPQEVVEAENRKTLLGLLNAPLRWPHRLRRALYDVVFVPLQMDECFDVPIASGAHWAPPPPPP